MSKNAYAIPFSGLKEGIHPFYFKVGGEFFEQLDCDVIQKAALEVNVSLEKKTTMLVLRIAIEGEVEVMCDRCTDDLLLSIKGEDELIYQFGEGISDDEKIVVLPPHEVQIDVTHPIYETTVLALPLKRTHPEGECNPAMLEAMDHYLIVSADEVSAQNSEEEVLPHDIDPRWKALKKLIQ